MRRMTRLCASTVLGLVVSAILVLMVCLPALADQAATNQAAKAPVGSVIVYTFGRNTEGELGLGDLLVHPGVNYRYYGYCPSGGHASVFAISADEDHSLLVLNNTCSTQGPNTPNTLYGFGDNWSGVLGLQDGASSYWYPSLLVPTPTVITDFLNEQILLISAGQDFTLVLSRNASGVTRLYSFGRGDHGELGIGPPGSPPHRGKRQAIAFFDNKTVRAISAGGCFSLVLVEEAITHNSQLYGFGRNDEGQLGLNNITSPITVPTLINGPWSGPYAIYAISAGGFHSLVLTQNGNVYAFGRNYEGQLGLGNTATPVKTPTLLPMTGFKGIDAGWKHSLFLYQGSVASCGLNDKGQLGLGNLVNVSIPTLVPTTQGANAISAGAYHSLFLKGQTAYGFGDNSSYQLGLTTPVVYKTPQLLPVNPVSQIAAGWWHSILVGM